MYTIHLRCKGYFFLVSDGGCRKAWCWQHVVESVPHYLLGRNQLASIIQTESDQVLHVDANQIHTGMLEGKDTTQCGEEINQHKGKQGHNPSQLLFTGVLLCGWWGKLIGAYKRGHQCPPNSQSQCFSLVLATHTEAELEMGVLRPNHNGRTRIGPRAQGVTPK